MELILDKLAAKIAAEVIRYATSNGIAPVEAWNYVMAHTTVALTQRLERLWPQVVEIVEREAFAASVFSDIDHL